MTESTNPGSPARRTTEDERSDALDALGQTLGTAPNVVRHAYGDDADQFVEVHGDPATASAVVIFVHGGYFRPSIDFVHARPLAQDLAGRGLLCVLVEYGRIGGQPRCLTDVTAAIRFAQDAFAAWGVPAAARERPVVAGHSAGGCLVLSWASHLGEDGAEFRLRPLAPISDLLREANDGLADGAVLDYMGAPPQEDLAAYLWQDPRSRAVLIPARANAHIIHGDADGIVAVSFSENYPAPLTILPGADHMDLVDPESSYFPQVIELLLADR